MPIYGGCTCRLPDGPVNLASCRSTVQLRPICCVCTYYGCGLKPKLLILLNCDCSYCLIIR